MTINLEACAGILILAIIVVDVVITTLTLGGGGPITSRLSAGVWRLALRFRRWSNRRSFLGVTGWRCTRVSTRPFGVGKLSSG